MKKEIRLIGIDDSPFDKFKDKNVIIVGVFYRGGNYPDGVMASKVKVDGSDSTKEIIKMVNKCKFKPQLQCILLDGIAFGGFNIIDIEKVNKKTKLPVVVIIRRMPDIKNIKNVLIKLKKQKKIKLLEKAGKVYQIENIYIQKRGITLNDVKKIIKISATHSYLPEPIRVAHLIGQGLKLGESKGKA